MDRALIRRALGDKVQFIQGDDACAYGALLAGCNFFAGYPITPATEVAEQMSILLPLVGGCYIQMEDEIASMGALVGASWTGAKTMTSTSGPGFSLMQENLGYAIMTETPCVVVNVQRSGPSTGQPTMGAYGDMMQARWGTHGDHEIIMLCPASIQESLDLTIVAFNLSEQFRTPVLLFIDGELGHMRERLVIPDEDELELVERPMFNGQGKYLPFATDASLVPTFAPFGSGHRTYVTGLTHNEQGLPRSSSAEIHDKLVRRLADKINNHRDQIIRYEEFYADDCDIAIITYGITARTCRDVVEQARSKGIKVGMLRLITIWPFPDDTVARWSECVQAILVPEMNLGQMIHPIREAVAGRCKVAPLFRIGGEIHTPVEILTALEELQCQLC
ncbi:2-oxoacid:acceptor oxidoreductase subunit alpha [Candidatus Viridilinea mediisalina]|uniref:2-oxoglutarate synthase subunit alpha n=1 Tax=Candidatus Viridilinea mediisalina TaxID=2024553 RepID=A0A2A6RJI2_9CHLR|nr:2-oxoacid:acceptor oxidoreductase subunit alpha [Candidatus Viridilinea mediisalina]PDW03049.1 2-oxoglutarate synthase subunit alpha [Candidatus Viridilinea mediisalina]